MKKAKLLLVTAATLAITNIASAQKGGILLYGDLGINSTNVKNEGAGESETTKNMTFKISPGIGYGVSENLIVGLNFGFSSSKITNPSSLNGVNIDLEDNTTSYNVGPFVRYTKTMGDIFSCYMQANVGYMGGNTSSEYVTNDVVAKEESTMSGFGLNIFPAIGVNCGKGWGLNFGYGNLGFSSSTAKPKNSTYNEKQTTSDFGLNFNGSSLHWGISKMFGGGSK